jgi:arylsulfatase A-like enzyme
MIPILRVRVLGAAARMAAALGVAALLVTCGAHRRPEIVVIVIDTLRADRLGAYGNPRGLTPFLDQLAGRAFVFRNAYAQSSWTGASVASLFTSRYQSEHGVLHPTEALQDSELTLAEVLKAAGYATAGFTANFMVGKHMGFGQGFDRYDTFWLVPGPDPTSAQMPVRAARVIEGARDWVHGTTGPENARPPRFLYLQLMEPHPAYAPPAPAMAKLRGGRPPADVGAINALMLFGNRVQPGPDERAQLEDVYDAEVIAVDDALRSLFGEAAFRDLLARAVVVITADHGEGFGDHELLGHGATLYNELIRVPLLVLTPAQARRVDVDDVVQLIDVAPTLVGLAGITLPQSFEGRSFAGLLSDAPGFVRHGRSWLESSIAPRSAYSELFHPEEHDTGPPHHERTLVVGAYKLAVRNDGSAEFYDLDRDPTEKGGDDVPERDRERVRRVFARVKRARPPGASQPRAPVDEATRARLRALGYAD